MRIEWAIDIELLMPAPEMQSAYLSMIIIVRKLRKLEKALRVDFREYSRGCIY